MSLETVANLMLTPGAKMSTHAMVAPTGRRPIISLVILVGRPHDDCFWLGEGRHAGATVSPVVAGGCHEGYACLSKVKVEGALKR